MATVIGQGASMFAASLEGLISFYERSASPQGTLAIAHILVNDGSEAFKHEARFGGIMWNPEQQVLAMVIAVHSGWPRASGLYTRDSDDRLLFPHLRDIEISFHIVYANEMRDALTRLVSQHLPAWQCVLDERAGRRVPSVLERSVRRGPCDLVWLRRVP